MAMPALKCLRQSQPQPLLQLGLPVSFERALLVQALVPTLRKPRRQQQ